MRLVLFVVPVLRALLPFESQKLILKGVRGNTCQSTRVVCGNAHPVDFVGSIKATDILCEHEQRRVFDLVEDTFCGALLDNLASANRESEKAGTHWLNVGASWTVLRARNARRPGPTG